LIMNNIHKYLLTASAYSSLVASKEPNPPVWDTDKVILLEPGKSHTNDNQHLVDSIFNITGAPDLGG